LVVITPPFEFGTKLIIVFVALYFLGVDGSMRHAPVNFKFQSHRGLVEETIANS